MVYLDEAGKGKTKTILEEKNFVAIGKMFVHIWGEKESIPDLCFIVEEVSKNNFEATNIDLVLDTFGKTIEDSVAKLVSLTGHHISNVLTEGHGFDEFIEAVASGTMDDYRRFYKIIDFTLAKTSENVSSELSRKINEMLDSNYSKLFVEKLPLLIQTVEARNNSNVIKAEQLIAEFSQYPRFIKRPNFF
jgi:hypothetical protein